MLTAVSADTQLRAIVADLPAPEFAETAFTTPPALRDATVAIVTSAALQRPNEEGWDSESSEFRVFGRNEHDLLVGNVSVNFDRSGISADLNVAYPIDRLVEMESDGAIGAVAPRHVAFIGSTNDLMTIIMDTGPAAARLLRGDGVDVVLLTPV